MGHSRGHRPTNDGHSAKPSVGLVRAREWVQGDLQCVSKALVIVVLLLLQGASASAQPGVWTWMRGTYGVCDPTPNEPPCGYAFAHWADTAGQFWVNVSDGLWKYNVQANTWSHVHPSGIMSNIQAPLGVYDSLNTPGYVLNGAYTWTTSDDVLWLYGGIGGCTLFWKYSIALDQWAWMGTYTLPNYGIKGVPDSTNSPGCMGESNAAWVDDAGDLWMFGSGDPGNSMWKYEMASGWWTWMSGSNNFDAGSYGMIGVPSINDYPSSRWTNFYWKDDSGDFWVGLGFNGGYIATDIWRFDPVTLEWTWMSGSPNAASCTPSGVACDTTQANHPGGRFENRTMWRISDKLIITYAGKTCTGYYNDLWAYLPLQSIWVKLDDYSISGHYGTLGVPSSLDYPRYRIGAAGFKDRSNNLWVYSGWTFGSMGNDLWRYELDWHCIPYSASGINDEFAEPVVSLYPNPVFSSATLELDGNYSAAVLRIFSAIGEQVWWQPISARSTTISLEELQAGIYFYHLTSRARILASGKLVRE